MKKLLGTILKKIGVNKGAPRVWIEGIFPERAGFKPGQRYTATSDPDSPRVILRLDDAGMRLVSSKQKADRNLPILDLNSHELLAAFEGMEKVRVILMEGEIQILPDAVEVKVKDRMDRLRKEVEQGRVSIASVSHGVGVLSHAMHEGFKSVGVRTKLSWACEIREEVLEQAAYANASWDKDTIALGMPLQNLAFADEYTLSKLPKPSILEGGLPCTAASLSGRSKKGLAMAEDDKEAGHLVAAFIALIAKVNPAIVTLENVRPYFSTASASILRTQLEELGYVIHEKDIEGQDYAIEARPRHVLIAATKGIDLNLEAMIAPPRAVQTVGEILEPLALDDESWRAVEYLKAKQERDQAAGKGFSMQLIEPSSTRVGTIGTGYQRARSTEPRLVHPTNPELSRLFTPTEHARLKGVPPELIKGVESKTFAHELLGQSVIWPAFKHLGQVLAKSIVPNQQPQLALEAA